MSASTANSSWSVLGFFENETADATYVNGTFNSTVLEDSNDYIFNATCRNQTNFLHQGTRSGITIQNTVPTAPVITTHSNLQVISTTGTQTFSSTVTDARTTGCTYTIARGGATSGDDYTSGTATYSATTCSFTKAFSTTTDNGEWYVITTASDGTDTTNSVTTIVSVQLPASNGGLPASVGTLGNTIKDNSLLIVGVVAGIILIIGIWIISKK
jgi:hypothetical protein